MEWARPGGQRTLGICLALLAVLFLALGIAAQAKNTPSGRAAGVVPVLRSSSLSPGWVVGRGGTGERNYSAVGIDQDPGVIVDPTELWVDEPNGTVRFNISLATKPRYLVTILLTPSNQQCSISRSKVELRQSNWRQGVDIAVTTSFGIAVDGEQICIVQTGPAVSDDPVYNGRRSDDVYVFAGDIIPAGITVLPTSLEISEPAGSAVFTMSLTAQPVPSVAIPIATSNTQCTVSPTVALLDAQNWSSGAPVTVTAFDDGEVDGDQECVVKSGPPSGGDPRFGGLTGDDVTVTVHDTDIPPPTSWAIYLPLVSQKWPPIPGIPDMQPIDNPDGDGDYSVAWTTAPGAETYVLEEADNSAFNSADQVYTGPSTSYSVPGQTTGRFYYRVKARNSWGDSAWSNPQAANVLWESEPNNEASEANGALVSGLSYRGRFPSRADEYDYYYFDLPATGAVELWLRDIPAGQDYNLVLRDANLKLIGYSAGRGTAPEHIAKNGLSLGRYYAQVWNYTGDGSTLPYELQVVH